MKLLLIVLLLVPAGYSQYPGQYPPGQYPPGSYPPGTYPPNQGTGIPFPRKSKSNGKTNTNDQNATQTFKGTLQAVTDKSIDVEAPDERVITFQITATTKKPDAMVAGDEVEVEATKDDKGLFNAVNIKRTKAAPAQTADGDQPRQLAPEEIEQRPTTRMQTPVPLEPDDEGGPPKLKRGIPKPRTVAASGQPAGAAPSEIAQNEPPRQSPAPEREAARSAPVNSRMEFIDKAREAAAEFLSALPNYVVQQFTTRYVSAGHVSNWQAQDVVSAEVIYEDHKERYQNIQINGKAVKTAVEDTGAWSTGEFGTVLEDLFSPATDANFKFIGERTIARQSAVLYDFDVDHPHSHWKIHVPGQSIMPAYHGSVWIQKSNARVLRIEMQAVKIPVEFPDDTTEMALDYDYTNLGAGTERYLLPVKAEILSCQRGTNMCQRNTIEFRNYHKYSGESTITFH